MLTDGRPCEHVSYNVCERSRTVTCRHCGAQVDPFTVLLLTARWWEARRQFLGAQSRAAREEAMAADVPDLSTGGAS